METRALFKLTYGVFVVTSRQNEKDYGCIINSAIQVVDEPNQISIVINKTNYTHDRVKETGLFNISVISERASFDLFKRFGFQSGRVVNKFLGFDGVQRGESGLCYITEGTNAFFSIKVEDMIDLGSHTMFIGQVTQMEILSEDNSMTYSYYQKSIKPKPEVTR